MSRRALTLLLGCLLALGLALAGGYSTVPYVALSPGPAIDTLGDSGGEAVLAVTGARTYPTDGSLSLTTVSVRQNLTLFEALAGWLSRRQAVIPREIVIPPDTTDEEQEKENAEQFASSQDAATTAALRELGYPEVTTVTVAEVTEGAPADGRLRPGDVVTTVDGKPVTDAPAVGRLIRLHSPGETVRIGYTRDGRVAQVTLTTVPAPREPQRALIGITPRESSVFRVKVDIRLEDIGGPSAGLMFALGIIDKLGPESVTGGRDIAGTGEITADGTIGGIGGIAEKMLGAREAGATAFLVPAANCPGAKDTRPDGLTLVKVETLRGALAALAVLRSGGTPPSC